MILLRRLEARAFKRLDGIDLAFPARGVAANLRAESACFEQGRFRKELPYAPVRRARRQ